MLPGSANTTDAVQSLQAVQLLLTEAQRHRDTETQSDPSNAQVRPYNQIVDVRRSLLSTVIQTKRLELIVADGDSQRQSNELARASAVRHW